MNLSTVSHVNKNNEDLLKIPEFDPYHILEYINGKKLICTSIDHYNNVIHVKPYKPDENVDFIQIPYTSVLNITKIKRRIRPKVKTELTSSSEKTVSQKSGRQKQGRANPHKISSCESWGL